ncbi:hypothetical protein JHK85_000841 [Glycine max]|nr:hypothetical protein JHK85_000841 [Glycine max]
MSPRSPDPRDISPGTTLWSTNKSRKSDSSTLSHIKLVGLWGTLHMWRSGDGANQLSHFHKSNINVPSPVAHLQLSSLEQKGPTSSLAVTSYSATRREKIDLMNAKILPRFACLFSGSSSSRFSAPVGARSLQEQWKNDIQVLKHELKEQIILEMLQRGSPISAPIQPDIHVLGARVSTKGSNAETAGFHFAGGYQSHTLPASDPYAAWRFTEGTIGVNGSWLKAIFK